MRPPCKRQKALLIVLLLALAVTVPRIPMLRPRVASAISYSDWTISNVQVVQDQAITLDGNLTVESGGNLTFVDSVLTVNSQHFGQYYITVMPGGSMYVYNSEITSSNAANGYSLVVDGNYFIMKNSQLYDAGWCDTNSSGTPDCNEVGNPTGNSGMLQHGGPIIQTNGAIIEESKISANAIGLILEGNSELIQGNNFTNNVAAALMLISSSQDRVVNSSILESSALSNDQIYLNAFSNNNVFENNTLTWIPVNSGGTVFVSSGFSLQQSQNNIISFNKLRVSDPFSLLGASNNTILDNNISVWGDAAMNIVSSGYTRVINNSIVLESNAIFGSAWTGAPAPGGIELVSCPNTTVSGDVMTGNSGAFSADLFLAHSPGSLVQNNKFLTLTNSPGVYIYSSQNDTVSGNLIANSWQGLWLYYESNNNIITDNVIYSNSTSLYYYSPPKSAIIIGNSSDNTIYRNNFFDGGGGPYDNGKNNWSFDGVGNYWNFEHNGSSVSILPNGRDSHPLTHPAIVNETSVSPLLEQISKAPNGSPYNLDITGKVAIDNQVDTYSSGQLNVQAGGELIINDSTLTFESFGGSVNVGSGGKVVIDNSTLFGLSGLGNNGPGGSVVVSKSTILCGQNWQLGFGMGANITISDSSVISTGPFGFNFFGPPGGASSTLNITNSELVGGSPIGQLSGGTITMSQGSLYIANSTMRDSLKDILFSGSDATILNSTFRGAWSGPSISASTVVFQENTVQESGLGLSGTNVAFAQNKITSDWGAVVQIFAGVTSTVGNVVQFERGFQPLAVFASNSLVSDNTLANTLSDGGYGIFLNGNNNTVTGNQVGTPGISVGGSDNILTNNTIANSTSGLGIYGNNNVVYHNDIINCTNPASQSGSNNSWSYNGEGNYWSSYAGSDSNLDGIGDTPFSANGVVDNYPFMQPNGWLTKFYLTVQANLTTTLQFEINGSNFTVSNGIGNFRLGYDTNYSFTFPQTVRLSNGTFFQFVKWNDGYSGTTRTFLLSSNSTIEVFYQKQAQQQTTTTSVTTSSTSTSSSSTTSSTSLTSSSGSNPPTSLATTYSQSSTTSKGGGVPEFPYSAGIIVVFVAIIMGAYAFLRRRPGMRNLANYSSLVTNMDNLVIFRLSLRRDEFLGIQSNI